MNNLTTKKIVENIIDNKFNTLKKDFSKIVSLKAVTILENKKVMKGKNFFDKMNTISKPEKI